MVAAAAWLVPEGVAAWRAGSTVRYGGRPASEKDWRALAARWFDPIPRNFSRFPDAVKAACGVAAMILRELGLPPNQAGTKRDIGVIGLGFQPTQTINREFYQDYLDHQRVLGRGNLFIYTLPTAPLAEVSIACGLTGPTFFLEDDRRPLPALLTTAASSLARQQSEAVIGLWLEPERVAGLFFQPAPPTDPAGLPLSRLQQMAEQWRQPERLIEFLLNQRKS